MELRCRSRQSQSQGGGGADTGQIEIDLERVINDVAAGAEEDGRGSAASASDEPRRRALARDASSCAPPAHAQTRCVLGYWMAGAALAAVLIVAAVLAGRAMRRRERR